MAILHSLFSLTGLIVSTLIFLIIVALLNQAGMLDETAKAVVAILLIPVDIVKVFVDVVRAALAGNLFGGPA